MTTQNLCAWAATLTLTSVLTAAPSIGGTPVQHIDEVRGTAGSVALLSDDFVGQQLSPLVQVGDRVRLAEPLAVDLDRARIHHTSPGAGTAATWRRPARASPGKPPEPSAPASNSPFNTASATRVSRSK